MDLKSLLYHALNDGAVYSALVPWMLDCRQQAPTLSAYVQQRQVLQQYQLQVAGTRPRDMRQCVLLTVEQCCSHACSLHNDACPAAAAASSLEEGGANQDSSAQQPSSKQPAQQPTTQPGGKKGSTASASCSLSQPAMRLSKLHGHMLAHGLVPNLAEQLHMLVVLLTLGPLMPSSSSSAATKPAKSTPNSGSRQKSGNISSNNSSNNSVLKQKGKQQQPQEGSNGSPAAAEAGSPCPGPITGPEQLLCCRACAARYAAKALECCSKLLCCLPKELLQQLAASPHAQQYGQGLAALLVKAAAAAGSTSSIARSPAGGSSGHPAALHAQQQHHNHQQHHSQQAGGADAAPNSSSKPGSAGGPGAAGGSWGLATPGRGSGGPKLSGLGLLMPNTPAGSGSRSAGPGSAGRAASAAVCNREKSRDLFFSILRRCSSRLEALRQQQAAGAGLQEPQQRSAAAAVFNTELQELVADAGLAAKQLLLQLSPGNQMYLAELFTACVLQAASSGEPILEPQLALMAQRDPSKFHKLQQRLADRGSSSSPVPVMGQTAAAALKVPAGAGRGAAWPAEGKGGAAAAAADRLHTPVHNSTSQSVQQQQQSAKGESAFGGTQKQQQQQPGSMQHTGSVGSQRLARSRAGPQAQGLAATGLMYKLAPGSASSTGGNRQPSAPTAPRHIRAQPTTSSSANSTGSSFRVGMHTPLPFSACRSGAAGPSPGASPLTANGPGGALGGAAAATSQQAAWSVTDKSPLNMLSSRMGQAGSSKEAAGAAVGSAAGLGALAAAPQTPASAPAAAYGSRLLTAPLGAGSSAPPKAPASAPHKAPAAAVAASLSQQGNTHVVLQLLSAMPAGQHVLLLVLHAADSSSFNRSLLNVMLARAEKLLSSCPASLAAAGGLGHQASGVVAIASYCSYLSFVAGVTDEAAGGQQEAAGHPSSQGKQHQPVAAAAAGQMTDTNKHQQLLQQQPAIDIAVLLARVVSSSSGGHTGEVDSSWCLALAIPFVCQYLRFTAFNPCAATSQCVLAALAQLQALQALPCMAPTHAEYGSLAACLSSCLRGCQLLQQVEWGCQQGRLVLGADAQATADSELDDVAAAVMQAKQQQQQQHNGHAAMADAAGVGASADWLCSVLGHGSVLVDNTYWAICCPGLQHLSNLLADVNATAHKQQQQQPHRINVQPVDRAARGPSSLADSAASSSPGSSKTGAATGAKGEAASGAAASAVSASTVGTSSSPAGSSSLRHTTPLLLAPRAPPVLEAPPACVAAALAEVNDPIKQQLQQAFIGQYSTDDNPVKMRDVLALVNSILCANSLSLGVSQGVPAVLQQHLDLMQEEVQQQLAPAGMPDSLSRPAPLQVQDLARAVHHLCARHSAPAVTAALESAMQYAAQHACQAAASACAALLPADVPPAAASAAAALVASSCKASCAQRLLQEVPVLVQSTLADHADQLVRLISRQWAMHGRMTASTTAADIAAPALSNSTSPADGARLNNATGSDALQPQPASRDGQNGHLVGSHTEQAMPVVVTQQAGSPQATVLRGARRINPVPVAAAGPDKRDSLKGRDESCAEKASSRQTSSSCSSSSSSSGSSSSSCSTYAQPTKQGLVGEQLAAMASPAAIHAVRAPTGAMVEARTMQAATGQAEAPVDGTPVAATTIPVTAADLLHVCHRFDGAGLVGPASTSQVLHNMQLDVAVAVVEQRIQAAINNYIGAATQLVPSLSQALDVHGLTYSSSSSHGSLQCTDLDQHQRRCAPGSVDGAAGCVRLGLSVASAALSVASAALCAAEVLVAGVVAGSHSLIELEQQLLLFLTEQPKSQTQQHLGQLLAAAVLRVSLNNDQQKAAVWGGVAEATHATTVQQLESVGCNMPYFMKLPSLVMKAARADAPVWLLQQLRVWLQGATLGYV